MKLENRVSGGYKWLMLALVGLGYTTCCMTIWMFYSYYDLMQEYFQATNTQMGYMSLITGLVMIVCWPVGGMVADKISMRKAYIGCMIFTVVFFVILAGLTSFNIYLVMLFASCVMMGVYYTLFGKIVKGVSTPETEGKNTGYFWAIYALGGSVIGAFGSYFVTKMGMGGWRPLMYMFIGLAAVCAVVCFVALKEDKFNDWTVLETDKSTAKFQFSQVKKVLLMPEIWVASFIYFTMLMITCAGIRAVSMMKTVYMVPLGIVTFIGIFRQYLGRVVLSPTSGWLIDKWGSSMKVIRVFLIVTLVGMAVFFIFPMGGDYFWVGILLVVACTIGYGMQSPCWMTPISEIGVPVAYHGTAIGLYNGIGCISDAFIYILCGSWVDKYGDIKGNQLSIGFIAVMLVICFVLTIIETRMIKQRRDALGRPLTEK
ncbi:MAG: MFS transporter [Clostridia bacterium]|nr:MFS transporter [Clostridia bacterium]